MQSWRVLIFFDHAAPDSPSSRTGILSAPHANAACKALTGQSPHRLTQILIFQLHCHCHWHCFQETDVSCRIESLGATVCVYFPAACSRSPLPLYIHERPRTANLEIVWSYCPFSHFLQFGCHLSFFVVWMSPFSVILLSFCLSWVVFLSFGCVILMACVVFWMYSSRFLML